MFRHFLAKNGWYGLLILVVATGFGAVAFDDWLQANAIESRGLAGVATVAEMRSESYERRDSRGRLSTGTEHWITYAFQAEHEDGTVRPVRVERQVPDFIRDALVRGDAVEVRYLPDKPENAQVFEGELARSYRFLSLIAAAFGAVGLFMIPVPLRAALRARRLEVAGVEAEGVLERGRAWNGRRHVRVRFHDSAGVEREADATVDAGTSWGEARVGDPIRLRYDPANPLLIGPA